MGGVISSGPYKHNPLVGNRPMKFPYTLSAQIAQFPYVYHWRYTTWFKYYIYSAFLIMPIMWKLTQLVNSPSNVEKWKEINEEWYTKKPDPEDAYY